MADNSRSDYSARHASAEAPRAELPPQRMLYQLAIGHYVSRALALAAKLRIADAIGDGACSAQELAATTETQAPALRRVLRLLVSIGIFDEDDGGRFTLAPLGQLLRSDVPGSMHAMVSLFAGEGIQDDWKELEYCVRTGRPAFWKHHPGSDPFAVMAERDPAAAASFDKAMASYAPQTAAAVAAAYDFSDFARIVDVGGGNGAILVGVLRAYPKLRGTVFDLPQVADRAREHIGAAGLADRLDAAGGSFFESVPEGADAYLLKHIIHDWNDDDAMRILTACRNAMSAHAKLLIVEGLYPARIDRSLDARGAAANDVNMLVCTGGRQRSDAEFRALYEQAGFSLTRIVATAANVSVIEGVRC